LFIYYKQLDEVKYSCILFFYPPELLKFCILDKGQRTTINGHCRKKHMRLYQPDTKYVLNLTH